MLIPTSVLLPGLANGRLFSATIPLFARAPSLRRPPIAIARLAADQHLSIRRLSVNPDFQQRANVGPKRFRASAMTRGVIYLTSFAICPLFWLLSPLIPMSAVALVRHTSAPTDG
jgi:hypothetical protein